MIKNLVGFRKELEKVNEWWLTSRVKEAERFPFRREAFNEIRKEIETRRCLVITGPRRVGKSVLLKQTIQFLIKEGTNPRNILYYSLDDPTLYTFSDNLIKDLIDYFLENIAKKGRKYIFLDEIHVFEGWYKWIKAYYDKYENLKFFLSGSSSLALQEEANKYLRGRIITLEIFPLSFLEFLRLSGLKIKEFKLEDIFKLDELEIKKLWYEVKEYFQEFLVVGGFPEWFEIKGTKDEVERWFRRLIEDVPKKAIYEDVVKLFGIKNPRVLELILTFIAANQSKILAYETINDVAKLDRSTLLNYLEFLKSSYLLVEILKFARLKEQLKAKKKFLLLDQGIRNAILKEYEIREENLGFVIENVVGNRLYLISKEKNRNLFYWKINDEVDFVLRGEKILPVEVKYRDEIKPKDIKGLLNFMEKFKVKEGFVITKSLLKREKMKGKFLYFIPCWLFLLLAF